MLVIGRGSSCARLSKCRLLECVCFFAACCSSFRRLDAPTQPLLLRPAVAVCFLVGVGAGSARRVLVHLVVTSRRCFACIPNSCTRVVAPASSTRKKCQTNHSGTFFLRVRRGPVCRTTAVNYPRDSTCMCPLIRSQIKTTAVRTAASRTIQPAIEPAVRQRPGGLHEASHAVTRCEYEMVTDSTGRGGGGADIMVQKWAIGAMINISGSIAINLGTNLMKLSHKVTARNASCVGGQTTAHPRVHSLRSYHTAAVNCCRIRSVNAARDREHLRVIALIAVQ